MSYCRQPNTPKKDWNLIFGAKAKGFANTSAWDTNPANTTGAPGTLSNSNRTWTSPNTNHALSTQGRPANALQNRYFEVLYAASPADDEALIGLGTEPPGALYPGDWLGSYAMWGIFGNYVVGTPVPGASLPGTAYASPYTVGDVIGVRLNNGVLTFYKNGVSQGVAGDIGALSGAALVYPGAGTSNTVAGYVFTLNTGNAAFFAGAAPGGALAWG